MSRCHWIAIIAIAGWLIAFCDHGLARPPEGERQTDNAKNQQPIAQTFKPEPAPPAPDKITVETGLPQTKDRIAQPERDEHYYDKADLEAQRAMAISTERIMWLTGGQLLLAAVGTGLLLWSLQLTRRATQSAVAAANSADQANKTTQDFFKMEQRAWIVYKVFEQHEVRNSKRGNEDFEGKRFSIVWANSGHTHAINCHVWNAHKLLRNPFTTSDAAFYPTEIPDDIGGAKAIVWSEQFVSTRHMYVSTSEIEQIKARELRLLIWSRCDYSTIFTPNETCVSEVCFELVYSGRQTLEDGHFIEQFDARPFGSQNRAT